MNSCTLWVVTTADKVAPTELAALAQLGCSELAGAIRGVAKVHRAVTDRVFAVTDRLGGSSSRSAHLVHDAVADTTYESLSAMLEAIAEVGATLPEPRHSPSEGSRGALVLAILDGLIGDSLADQRSPLAQPMSIRVDGMPVAVEAEALRAAFPEATGHIVVFLHGLMESEHAWRRGNRPTYGERLATDIGATEVRLRFNTGRHISDNGRELAALLNDLMLQWPVPVSRLTLIGHSMGGLIIRSACHSAATQHAYWCGLVTETVSLGTPHFGAPLARTVHFAAGALRSVSVTAPFGNLLGRRSAGVRDLFHGSLVDDDWSGRDPDAFRQHPATAVPLLPQARHLFVTASLTRDPNHPLGRFIGDGLVLTPSGRGESRARSVGFTTEHGLHLGGASHFTLLNDDDVYRWLLEHLRPRRALPPGRSQNAAKWGVA